MIFVAYFPIDWMAVSKWQQRYKIKYTWFGSQTQNEKSGCTGFRQPNAECVSWDDHKMTVVFRIYKARTTFKWIRWDVINFNSHPCIFSNDEILFS